MQCVSYVWICLERVMCCHTQTEITDPTCYLTHSEYTDTWSVSQSPAPLTPGQSASPQHHRHLVSQPVPSTTDTWSVSQSPAPPTPGQSDSPQHHRHLVSQPVPSTTDTWSASPQHHRHLVSQSPAPLTPGQSASPQHH